jgi:phosphoglucosamine mutase
VDKSRVDSCEPVQAEVSAAEVELEGVGRVLLRKSGTEPLVRVMVEADDAAQARAVAERLAAVVAKNLAL